ncbi:hypothetical protein [Streptomyces apricus]|uniref:Uncharacterized protein n=1 Tax=Streptomyces apricus TaxID=1828112 RepID=A0A5B0BAI6_9ACTN|nr:hypothetical protein [Streptomyces apricus]KAA0939248.1 hypothetical protein FGF04_12365 [Streptomyces apricus]
MLVEWREALRKRSGEMPWARRKAAPKANSLEYPSPRATTASGTSLSRSRHPLLNGYLATEDLGTTLVA